MDNTPYKERFCCLAYSPRGSDESITAFESFKSRMDKARWHKHCKAASWWWCIRVADLVFLLHPETVCSFNHTAGSASSYLRTTVLHINVLLLYSGSV